MHIIYVTGESYIDHSYTIAKELQKHVKFDIYFFARNRSEETDAFLKKFNAKYVRRTRFRNVLSIFKELGFILRLRRVGADCVWFDTLTIYQVWLVKYLLSNYLVLVHDVEIHPETGDKHGKLSVKLTLKKYRRNICVASEAQATEFENKTGIRPKVFQLPVIDYYKETGYAADPEPGDREAVRFFFFGSVEKYKGLETLLDAAEILNARGLKFEINIYGKLRYDEERFLERIKVLKNVTLLNKFIDYKEIHKIYAANDVIVLPYKQVTQCGPLLIGYSENTPAIVNDLPGFKEYTDDNFSGIIFNGTAEGLAEKIEILIRNPEKIKEMNRYVSTKIQERFSMSALAEKYISNFKK